MSPFRSLRIAGPAVCLLLVLSVVACGGDDDDDPTTTSTTAVPSTTAATSTAAAPTPTASPTEAAFPVTVTDSSGTTITFTEAPARIISYSPGATEVLFAVGASDQVIAVDRFSDYPPETAEKAKLEYSRPAPEPALELQPDLVIMATRQEGQLAQFRDLGMRVLLLKEPADVAGVLAQIRLIGRITGHAAEADRTVAAMQERIDALEARLATVGEGPLVFYEVTAELHTVAPETFIGSLLTIAKARNVAAGATTPFPQISAEAVISANPAVILLADGGGTGGQSLETVRARPGWAGIDAVASERVHVIDGNVFSRPGPRVVDALEQLVEILYPELP